MAAFTAVTAIAIALAGCSSPAEAPTSSAEKPFDLQQHGRGRVGR